MHLFDVLPAILSGEVGDFFLSGDWQPCKKRIARLLQICFLLIADLFLECFLSVFLCAMVTGGLSDNGFALVTFSDVTDDTEVSQEQHRHLLRYFFSLLV